MTAAQSDTLQRLCTTLKQETLEPAKKQAEEIIAEAKKQAETLLAAAEQKALTLVQEAEKKAAQELRMARTSLTQAAKQAVAFLRQEVENHLFNSACSELFDAKMADSAMVARFLDTLLEVAKEAALTGDFTGLLGEKVDAKEVASLLAKQSLQLLQEGKMLYSAAFPAGVKLQIKEKNITLDLSDSALKSLLSGFVRKDFQQLLFA